MIDQGAGKITPDLHYVVYYLPRDPEHPTWRRMWFVFYDRKGKTVADVTAVKTEQPGEPKVSLTMQSGATDTRYYYECLAKKLFADLSISRSPD